MVLKVLGIAIFAVAGVACIGAVGWLFVEMIMNCVDMIVDYFEEDK